MNELETLVQMGKRMKREPGFVVELAERWLRIRDREGWLRPLVANAAQRRFEERRGRENIVLKARQMGMTTWVSARFFLRTITTPGTMTLQVAQTREAAETIFRVVQRMWEGLPDDLREGPLRRSRANAGSMMFAALDSEFRVASAADENAGRGLSVQNLHCSEVSRWPGDAGATLAGLRAALVKEGELVLESTPQGAYGAFYEQWGFAQQWSFAEQRGLAEQRVFAEQRGLAEQRGFAEQRVLAEQRGLASESDEDAGGLVRHFFPWWMEPAYVGPRVRREAMTEPELALVEAHGLSGEQIGYRRGLERSYGALRSQEFAEDAESCFRATGACCFEVEAIETRMAELDEPVAVRRNGALLVWKPAVAGKAYVVAVDTAGGGEEGDFAAVQVVEMESGFQCAELQEKLRPADLARVVAALAKEYGEALVAIERNNHGAAVLAYLETSERYAKVYRQGREAGWLTTSASKPEMVARLSVLLVEASGLFASRRLLAECRTYVAGERGKTGAAGGAHDDLVMAMGVAQAVRAERVLLGC